MLKGGESGGEKDDGAKGLIFLYYSPVLLQTSSSANHIPTLNAPMLTVQATIPLRQGDGLFPSVTYFKGYL